MGRFKGSFNARSHATETLFFWRLEELLYLRKHIFSDAFEITRVFDFTNLLSKDAADLFACGDGGGGDSIRALETEAYWTEIGAAGTAVLTHLTLFGTAFRTIHGVKYTARRLQVFV